MIYCPGLTVLQESFAAASGGDTPMPLPITSRLSGMCKYYPMEIRGFQLLLPRVRALCGVAWLSMPGVEWSTAGKIISMRVSVLTDAEPLFSRELQ